MTHPAAPITTILIVAMHLASVSLVLSTRDPYNNHHYTFSKVRDYSAPGAPMQPSLAIDTMG